MRKAYSYQRYSSAGQSDGDTLNRQTGKAYLWWKREIEPLGIPLDEEARCDRGLSAYKGEHLKDGGALATFLSEIKAGTIEPGSILIAENLDRISRQGPKIARKILEQIVDNGVEVHIVNISTKLTFGWENDPTKSIIVDIELGRALKESEYKSERIGSAWKVKRANAASKLVTRNVPLWLEVKDGQIVEKQEVVAAVREAFRLASLGLGCKSIISRLNGSLPGGLSWLLRTFQSRAVLGELQTFKRFGNKRVPDGEPVADYYPQIVSRQEWQEAREQVERKCKNGRYRSGDRSSNVAKNLFSGLICDVTNQPVRSMTYMDVRGCRYLNSQFSPSDPRKPNRIRYDLFEENLLDYLLQMDWVSVTGKSESAELKAMSAELDGLLSEIDKTDRLIQIKTAAMEDPELDPDTIKVLASQIAKAETKFAALSNKRIELSDKINAVRVKAGALYNVETLKTLIAQHDPESNDVRLQLRNEIRKRFQRIELDFSFRIAPESKLVFVNFVFVDGSRLDAGCAFSLSVLRKNRY
jgi:hypothetical protein